MSTCKQQFRFCVSLNVWPPQAIVHQHWPLKEKIKVIIFVPCKYLCCFLLLLPFAARLRIVYMWLLVCIYIYMYTYLKLLAQFGPHIIYVHKLHAYTLWLVNIAMKNGPFIIDASWRWCPIFHMVIFHSYVKSWKIHNVSQCLICLIGHNHGYSCLYRCLI